MIQCIVLILLCAACLTTTAQPVSVQQQDLLRLRQSIEQTKQKINALSRKEKSAMKSLTSTQRQQKNLDKIIRQLQFNLTALIDSVRVLDESVSRTRSSIANTENRWSLLTRHMLEHLAATRGVEPSALLGRYVYVKSSTHTAEARRRLNSMADSLSSRMQFFGDVSQEQEYSLRQQQRERVRVASTMQQQALEIKRVRSSKQALLDELRAKQQSAARIRSIIQSLVAKERAAARKPPASSTKAKDATKKRNEGTAGQTVATYAPQRGAFTSRSLPWPTTSKSILHGYGTYNSPTTGTTHENPGIDISTAAGTSVRCVASGEVSTVTWLPGFGSLLIVDHQNGFRTVYANLAAVNVQRGSKVGQGASLGTSGSNMDGALVHFEVWIDGKRINPLTYLR